MRVYTFTQKDSAVVDSQDKKAYFLKRQNLALAGLSVILVLLVYGGWALKDKPSPATAPWVNSEMEGLVTAKLRADSKNIKAGVPFTVGVLLEIEPGWHVYWKNPGDAGLATVFKLELPEGFEVSQTNYPLPVRFTQPGDIVGFGYHDSVMLTAQVAPPADLAAGEEVKIKAALSYLVCKDRCVPGTERLELSLPVAKTVQADNSELFARWAQLRPRKSGEHESPRVIKLSGGISEGSRGASFMLHLEWAYPLQEVQCFPATPEGVIIDNFNIKTQGTVSEITFTVKELAGQTLTADKLDLLITATKADSSRAGVNIPIPLRSAEVNDLNLSVNQR
jgi:DsbC/DsbD-like thiol-disulfide interchange protein